MCGRFVIDLPSHRLAELFASVEGLPNTEPNFNVAPSQSVPVVRRHGETGIRHLDLLRWGLVPHWSRDKGRQPINARCETVATSPIFKGALAERRCIVPATAFYEWQQRSEPKQPFAFARQDGDAMALAGLWESRKAPDGEIMRTFAIITTAANAVLRPIHDRMPVVLEPADWATWLEDGPGDLMRPAQDDLLRRWPVSARVNSSRHNGPELLEEAWATGTQDRQEAGPDSA